MLPSTIIVDWKCSKPWKLRRLWGGALSTETHCNRDYVLGLVTSRRKNDKIGLQAELACHKVACHPSRAPATFFANQELLEGFHTIISRKIRPFRLKESKVFSFPGKIHLFLSKPIDRQDKSQRSHRCLKSFKATHGRNQGQARYSCQGTCKSSFVCCWPVQ